MITRIMLHCGLLLSTRPEKANKATQEEVDNDFFSTGVGAVVAADFSLFEDEEGQDLGKDGEFLDGGE